MPFNVGTFLHFWLLSMLSELFDRTFLLTSVFSVWCPWNGLREGTRSVVTLERFFVWLAVTVALSFRSLLLACGVQPFGWDGFCHVAAAALLALFGLRATVAWRSSVVDEETYADASEGVLSNIYGQPAYGAAAAPTPALADLPRGDKGAKGHKWSWLKELLTAFLMPGAAVLFAEAGDRSQSVLEFADHRRADLPFGAALGFSCTALVAVLCGYGVQKALKEKWLLLLIAIVLWCSSILSIRDALVRLVLGALPVGGDGGGTTAVQR